MLEYEVQVSLSRACLSYIDVASRTIRKAQFRAHNWFRTRFRVYNFKILARMQNKW